MVITKATMSAITINIAIMTMVIIATMTIALMTGTVAGGAVDIDRVA